MKALTKSQRVGLVSLFAVLAALAVGILATGAFRYQSVCDRCGAVRDSTDWRLPFTAFSIFTHSTDSDTSLSRVLFTNGIVQPHPHHWLFASGGGNGIKCAIGPGRHISAACKSAEFAGLVLMLHMRGETTFRDRVLRGALAPDTSDQFRGLGFNAPKPGVPDANLRAWIAEQSSYLDEIAAAIKKQ